MTPERAVVVQMRKAVCQRGPESITRQRRLGIARKTSLSVPREDQFQEWLTNQCCRKQGAGLKFSTGFIEVEGARDLNPTFLDLILKNIEQDVLC